MWEEDDNHENTLKHWRFTIHNSHCRFHHWDSATHNPQSSKNWSFMDGDPRYSTTNWFSRSAQLWFESPIADDVFSFEYPSSQILDVHHCNSSNDETHWKEILVFLVPTQRIKIDCLMKTSFRRRMSEEPIGGRSSQPRGSEGVNPQTIGEDSCSWNTHPEAQSRSDSIISKIPAKEQWSWRIKGMFLSHGCRWTPKKTNERSPKGLIPYKRRSMWLNLNQKGWFRIPKFKDWFLNLMAKSSSSRVEPLRGEFLASRR